jgi:hypothetical protein
MFAYSRWQGPEGMESFRERRQKYFKIDYCSGHATL